jgi:GMP synthase-like glutamine amidotransferase
MTDALQPPRALVLAHEFDGGACLIARRLEAHGYEVHTHLVCPDYHQPNLANPYPDAADYDVLLAMGSIRSLTAKQEISSWIYDELEMVRAAHARQQPVLGVCFGGQLIADALGGSVERAPEHEIGWFTIEGDANPAGPGPWMQWHHDRINPPPGADVLATSDKALQLFRVGSCVGTQFHPEVDPDHIITWIDGATHEYLADYGIDSATIIAETIERAAANQLQCDALVDWWLEITDAPRRAL